MVKAVVFDDEYIVTEGLRQMIDWTSFGIELAGSAADGLSALELFRELKPQIVFTDIRMPGMDGLQLIEHIMREEPGTYCVVFSGFNEFEYVKRAIKLGVIDYLEKPITIQSIEKALERVQEHMKEQREKQALQQQLEQTKQEMLEKATLDLLLLGEAAVDKWKRAFSGNKRDIAAVTVASCQQELQLFVRSVSTSGMSTYPEAYAFNEAADIIAFPVHYGEEKLVLFIHFNRPSEQIWQQLQQQPFAIGMGNTYPSLDGAAASYREAQKALHTARFLNHSGLMHYSATEMHAAESRALASRVAAIILSIRTGNKRQLIDQVYEFVGWMKQEKLDLRTTEQQMLKIIYLALDAFPEQQAELPYKGSGRNLPHVELSRQIASGNVFQWFCEQMEQIAGIDQEPAADIKHAPIAKAKAYIEANYMKELSLNEVAEHVGLTPAYLSVLFKEVVGESYNKFLTRYRMELAKVLLQKGMKVNEVSESVGYHTYRHFSEVFKKFTGQTPGQFKGE